VMGQAFRLRPLRQALEHCLTHKHRDRVWVTRPGDIAEFCYALPPGVIAAA
jgi:allantoinase